MTRSFKPKQLEQILALGSLREWKRNSEVRKKSDRFPEESAIDGLLVINPDTSWGNRVIEDFLSGNLTEKEKLGIMSKYERGLYRTQKILNKTVDTIGILINTTIENISLIWRVAKYTAFAAFVIGGTYAITKIESTPVPEYRAAQVYTIKGISEAEANRRLRGILENAISDYNRGREEPEVIIEATRLYFDSLKESGFRVDKGIELLKFIGSYKNNPPMIEDCQAASRYVRVLAKKQQTIEEGLQYIRSAIPPFSQLPNTGSDLVDSAIQKINEKKI